MIKCVLQLRKNVFLSFAYFNLKLDWLPKLHKKPYKARFIANSSSCTTTELSKLLTSCLTAVKNMLSNIVKRYMRDPVKTYFGRLKIQVKF